MKRMISFLTALLTGIALSVFVYADDIYIVDDGEEEFVPATTTAVTTTQATTAPSQGLESIFGEGSIEEYLGSFSEALGEGLDSILSDFGELDFAGEKTTAAEQTTELKTIQSGEITTANSVIVQQGVSGQDSAAVTTTQPTGSDIELPSVLIVENGKDTDGVISGSTLTLLVFIAAIVILILVGAIVLVILTKRTEYNSTVRSKSAIPGVAQPDMLSQFMDDGITDDGNDYGNITYWEDSTGDE